MLQLSRLQLMAVLALWNPLRLSTEHYSKWPCRWYSSRCARQEWLDNFPWSCIGTHQFLPHRTSIPEQWDIRYLLGRYESQVCLIVLESSPCSLWLLWSFLVLASSFQGVSATAPSCEDTAYSYTSWACSSVSRSRPCRRSHWTSLNIINGYFWQEWPVASLAQGASGNNST